MQNNDIKYAMDKIFDFIKLCISQPFIPISWGMYDIIINEEHLSFFVNGSKYQGFVKISNENTNLIVSISGMDNIFSEASCAFIWLDQFIE